jgi:hypothetical protein
LREPNQPEVHISTDKSSFVRKHLPKLAWLLVIVGIVGGVLAVLNARLILSKATWWIGDLGTIGDDLTLLIVEGGDQCFEKAAAWQAEAPTDRYLAVVETIPHRLSRRGLQPENHERALGILAKRGVAESQIIVIPRGNGVSIDEKHISIRRWYSQSAGQRVGILVDYLAVRRWTAQLTDHHRSSLAVIGLPNREYEPEKWHSDQQGIKAFAREALRLSFWTVAGEGQVADEWDEEQWFEDLAPAEEESR